jgi:hypothetical protein
MSALWSTICCKRRKVKFVTGTDAPLAQKLFFAVFCAA